MLFKIIVEIFQITKVHDYRTKDINKIIEFILLFKRNILLYKFMKTSL